MLSKEKKKSLYEKNIRRYETFDTCTPCAHRQSFLIFVTAGQTEDSGTGEGGKGKVGRRYESLRGNKILTKSTNAFLILLPWLPVHPSPSPSRHFFRKSCVKRHGKAAFSRIVDKIRHQRLWDTPPNSSSSSSSSAIRVFFLELESSEGEGEGRQSSETGGKQKALPAAGFATRLKRL